MYKSKVYNEMSFHKCTYCVIHILTNTQESSFMSLLSHSHHTQHRQQFFIIHRRLVLSLLEPYVNKSQYMFFLFPAFFSQHNVRFIPVVCIISLFFFIEEQCAFEWVSQNLFIQSLTDGYLGCSLRFLHISSQ